MLPDRQYNSSVQSSQTQISVTVCKALKSGQVIVQGFMNLCGTTMTNFGQTKKQVCAVYGAEWIWNEFQLQLWLDSQFSAPKDENESGNNGFVKHIVCQDQLVTEDQKLITIVDFWWTEIQSRVCFSSVLSVLHWAHVEDNFHSGFDVFINFPRSKLLALGSMPHSSASMAHPLISNMGQLIMIVYAHFCNCGTIIMFPFVLLLAS